MVEAMASIHYRWNFKRQMPRKLLGIHKVDVITFLNVHINLPINVLENLSINVFC